MAERILSRVPVVSTIAAIAAAVCGIALFVFWIMGLVSACQGTEKKVPVVGDIVLYR